MDITFSKTNPMQAVAARMLGEKVVVRRGVRYKAPAYSPKILESMVPYLYESVDMTTRTILKSIGVTDKTAEEFARVRRIVPKNGELSNGRFETVPNIKGVTDAPLSEYDSSEDGDGMFALPVDEESKRYTLNAVFDDATVNDKLGISQRMIQTAKRVATRDAVEAAALLTTAVRRRFPNVTITAGDFSRSSRSACNAIRTMCATIGPYKDLCVPSVIISNKIKLSYDLARAEKHWSVIGPLKYATEIHNVYQLALHYGPDHALFLLSAETLTLGIEIYDDISCRYYDGMLVGYSSLAGIQPMGAGMPSGLTAEQSSRLYRSSMKLRPIVKDDGVVVGTAVCLTDRHLLYTNHTKAEADRERVPLKLVGSELRTDQRLAPDLSVMRTSGLGAQWLMREARVDERVVLCYHVGDTVEYSEVLKVLLVHGSIIQLTSSAVLRKGASGAAVVALSDFALLGVFTTIRASKVECLAFGQRQLLDMHELDSISAVSDTANAVEFVEAGDRTYDCFIRRGLETSLQAMNSASASIHSRDSRAHLGTVACVGGRLFSTIPTTGDVTLVDGTLATFSRCGVGLWSALNPSAITSDVALSRVPRQGERVCVLARDGTSTILSDFTSVLAVGSPSAFRLDALQQTDENLTGGLVVAEVDGAFLGQYAGSTMDVFGRQHARCYRAAAFADVLTPQPISTILADDAVLDVRLRTRDTTISAEVGLRQMGDISLMREYLKLCLSAGAPQPTLGDITADITVSVCREFSKWFMRECLEIESEADRYVLYPDQMVWLLGYVCVHHSRYEMRVASKMAGLVYESRALGTSVTPRDASTMVFSMLRDGALPIGDESIVASPVSLKTGDI